MSQINVNKVVSPTQSAGGGPSVEVASNGNISLDTDTVFVDSTNDRLGIGTATPNRTLDIQQTGGISFNAGVIFEDCQLTGSGLSGTSHHSVEADNARYWNSAASGNWTYNIRFNSSTTLDSKMSTGETINISYVTPVGGSSYYQSGFTIDSSSVTVNWIDNQAPIQGGGRDSSSDPATTGYDVYTFAINKTGSNAYTVLGSQTHFGSF
ncbi:hypothetical protein PSSM7_040 [Prochlorococcus phage P-SSM7]|uniref:Sericin 1-like protein n=1 Tax=Prochlorococcus phage P-SSM7 TaxID=445688 RepID=E3SNF8_9CAUD|nr:hypothetical protein PSSM7_040 [Prochlorococcus phage P-SSM7]ADO99063.1 hypothetical protein PSSM7_040 [Prochlorococcus phage P-SSM7]